MRLYLFFCPVLIFFCTALSPVNAQSRPTTDCPEIKVKAEIIHTTEDRDNGKVVLKFDEQPETDKYLIILTCPGCGEPKKAVEFTFEDVKAGHYDIYVVDKQGCSKQLNIQVN